MTLVEGSEGMRPEDWLVTYIVVIAALLCIIGVAVLWKDEHDKWLFLVPLLLLPLPIGVLLITVGVWK